MPDLIQPSILLVEDNEDDVFLMKRSLRAAGVQQPMFVAEDGQQAIDYLCGKGLFVDRIKYPLPAMVFLDLKLPYKKGHEVLEWIRGRNDLADIVVVILTSSNETSDVNEAYRLGANSYVVKPPAAKQLEELAAAFKNYWIDVDRTRS